MASATAVGVVGLGLLGSAISEVLLEAGYPVVGYDVRPEASAELARRGGRSVGSAAEVAAAAALVFTVLPTLEAVEDAVAGAKGALEGVAADSILVQVSTISPALARRLQAASARAGVAFLDAPVSGTSAMVARRDCVVTVGGDPAAFERCRPVLSAISDRVYLVGGCGMGSYLKLVTNLMMGLNCAVIAEGLTLARRAGLDLPQTLEVLSHGAAASKMLAVRGPLMVEGRFEPQMKVDLFLKDIRLMLEAAQELHVPLPLAGAMQQLYTAAAAGGRATQDLASIASLYEAMAGLPAR